MAVVFAPSRIDVIRWRRMKRSASITIAVAWMCCLCFGADVSAQANVGVGAVLGPSSATREPFPEIAAIEAQLKELAARPDAHVASDLIDTSKRALQRARALATRGDTATAERAKQIAWAALSAASHTIARHHAELERAVVERRKVLAQAAAEAAREALERARNQTKLVEATAQ